MVYILFIGVTTGSFKDNPAYMVSVICCPDWDKVKVSENIDSTTVVSVANIAVAHGLMSAKN